MISGRMMNVVSRIRASLMDELRSRQHQHGRGAAILTEAAGMLKMLSAVDDHTIVTMRGVAPIMSMEAKALLPMAKQS